MEHEPQRARIIISKNGPYLIQGNVPLSEKIIVPVGEHYEYRPGRALPQSEQYALCRCGQSSNAPFCDGSHNHHGFIGTETASREKYADRSERLTGPGLEMLDDHRCALARFCHQEQGTAWDLVDDSDRQENYQAAIRAAVECPAGRLTALDKNGEMIEPKCEPAMTILQDQELGVSCGIYVQGYIPIESSDGQVYEIRNRVVLCRCGQSAIKPFCDAMHAAIEFHDQPVSSIENENQLLS